MPKQSKIGPVKRQGSKPAEKKPPTLPPTRKHTCYRCQTEYARPETSFFKAQVKAILPFIQTTRLVDELIKLILEVNGQWVKLREHSGMRKDRYSSLAYNIWVSKQIENELLRRSGRGGANNEQFKFFTAPRTRGWGLLKE